MKIEKKLKPGQPGTRKWVERFGEDLICIRYCIDKKNGQRLTTAEIIINKKPENKLKKRIPSNKIMQLKIDFSEKDLRKIIKLAGGKWNSEKKVWELSYREILALGLEEKILKAE